MNDPTGSKKDSGEAAELQVDRDSGMNWHRRAGPVFKYGLVVGFLLLLLGGMSMRLSMTNFILEVFVICAGLSIILGAFGSTAKVSPAGQGVVLVGVAGIAVVIFMLLIGEMNERYTRIKIGGDVKGLKIDLVGDISYLGAFQKSERTYDFIIFGKNIQRRIMSMYVELPDSREVIFECIRSKDLNPLLGSGKTIEWSFDPKSRKLVDAEGKQTVSPEGPCPDGPRVSQDVPAAREVSKLPWLFELIPTALAQTGGAMTAEYTESLINQLESNVSYERRDSRSDLAKGGVAVVQPLLAKLGEKDVTYRARLGVIVALTEMMRQNKANRAQIITKIKDEDLKRLVDASADEDRSIRIYASEFLYDLGDPRVIPVALDRFKSASEDGRYNLLLVTKGALPFTPGDQKSNAVKQVSDLKARDTPKTNELIDSIMAMK